jgi:hypothetical protein
MAKAKAKGSETLEITRLTEENARLQERIASLEQEAQAARAAQSDAQQRAARCRDAVNLAFARIDSVKQLHQNASDEAALNAQKATERIQRVLGEARQVLVEAKE